MSVYDFAYTSIENRPVPMSEYRGKVLLIVNVASKCGFTPQYEALEALYQKHKAEGLEVLGFPCDQFGHQEPGDDAQIAEYCRLNHGVTFPLSTKVEVNGRDTHPVFAFVKDRTGGLLGSAVKWNFTKFLVAPDGQTVRRYAPSADPATIAPDIEELLAQRAA